MLYFINSYYIILYSVTIKTNVMALLQKYQTILDNANRNWLE